MSLLLTFSNSRLYFTRWSHPGMFVEIHAGFRGDVLGADDLTVSLKSLELEELGC